MLKCRTCPRFEGDECSDKFHEDRMQNVACRVLTRQLLTTDKMGSQ